MRKSIGIWLTGVAVAAGGTLWSEAGHCGAKSSGYNVLYSFGGHSGDAASPAGSLAYLNGAIYGTSYYGGTNNTGAAYAVTPNGTELFVSSLSNATGYLPNAGITRSGKVFYGSGPAGGIRNCPGRGQHETGCGTLFRFNPKGKIKRILAFAGGADGSSYGAPPIDVGGTLYGVAGGGANGDGIFYSISPDGTYTILYSFGGGTDGIEPSALTYADGVFYGTTTYGGSHQEGTVFSMTAAGNETVLYSFGATASDATYPFGAPVLVNGVLYGNTMQGGGEGTCLLGSGCGAIYSVTLSGTEKVLYAFNYQDGQNNAPYSSPLLVSGGVLYGSNPNGTHGCGFLFSITTHGALTDLYDFPGDYSEGCGPDSPLLDVKGVFYGTTSAGGANNGGVLFSFTP